MTFLMPDLGDHQFYAHTPKYDVVEITIWT